jgi:hypothetical protein
MVSRRMDQCEIQKAADNLLVTLREELGLPSTIAGRERREQAILVKDLDGNPSYWLVPVASEDLLVGFLRLDLEGKLLAYGRFGQGRQLRDFPPLSYLSGQAADREIHKAFGSSCEKISPPKLVHDGPVDRIAWLSRGKSADGARMLLFWTFGTSYSRPEGEKPEYGLL